MRLHAFVKAENMASKKRSKPKPICVYCGVNPAVTGDHVVPKCLFLRPLPQDVVVVPACEACNRDKSKDDTYLRDALVMDYQGSESSIARTLFDTKVKRSAKRNSSDVVRAAMTRARFIPHITPGGLYLGQVPSFELDPSRMERIFSYIVRGLYSKVVRARLPAECAITVNRVSAKEADEIFHIIKGMDGNGLYRIGQGVFECAFMYATEEPQISFWLLAFYQRVFFIVGTEPLGGVVNIDSLVTQSRPE
jgi:hypothetical protein